MGRAFAEIAFTDSVKAAQARYGSREANQDYATETDRQDELTDAEREFIALRDGFFQATVSESGWPYVQFRGGPPGFLKVLGDKTIGFADFRGNIQYVSVGNINHDGRIALILVDHAHRSRLKLWGRARVVELDEEPDLVASLAVPSYRARVERGIVISIEAFDWNCPRHIMRRFTEAEIVEMTRPLREELDGLRARPRGQAEPERLGRGELDLTVTGVRILTPDVRAYELRREDGQPLPEIEAGSHLTLPVTVDSKSNAARHYSIASDPDDPMRWEIAVLRQSHADGSSMFVHAHYAPGTMLACDLPRNGFKLHDDHRPTVLVAGGIGIAPLKAMAHVLKRDQRWFALHFAARSSTQAPYLCELQKEFPDNLHTYWSSKGTGSRMNLEAVVRDSPPGSVFYVCAPLPMISEMQRIGRRLCIPEGQVRFERFEAPPPMATDRPFEVRLRQSDEVLVVPVGKSILDVLLEAGRRPAYDCRTGTCGTCATRVLEGEPDHRDIVLTKAEKTRERLICTCVSRCVGEHLTLDL